MLTGARKLVSFCHLFKNLEARLDFRRSLVSGLPSPSAGSFPEQRLVIELTLRRENSLCSQVINRSIFCDMNTVRYCYVAIYSAASSCELHSSLMVCSTFACKWSFFCKCRPVRLKLKFQLFSSSSTIKDAQKEFFL